MIWVIFIISVEAAPKFHIQGIKMDSQEECMQIAADIQEQMPDLVVACRGLKVGDGV